MAEGHIGEPTEHGEPINEVARALTPQYEGTGTIVSAEHLTPQQKIDAIGFLLVEAYGKGDIDGFNRGLIEGKRRALIAGMEGDFREAEEALAAGNTRNIAELRAEGLLTE